MRQDEQQRPAEALNVDRQVSPVGRGLASLLILHIPSHIGGKAFRVHTCGSVWLVGVPVLDNGRVLFLSLCLAVKQRLLDTSGAIPKCG